jgi:parallel beta-helix repeat protein
MFYFIPLLSFQLIAQPYFVAPSGHDRNPGTVERPFRTLERARDAVRSLNRSTPQNLRQPVTIWLRGGTYNLSRTFELTGEDSGLPTAPVTYKAYRKEPVRLSGGTAIPAATFRPVFDPRFVRRLPAEARAHIVQADLRALGITDFGRHRQFGHGLPVVPAPMELFWNDTIMQLARYPNAGAIDLGPVIDPGSMPRVGDYSNRGGRFRYTDDRHARWAGLTDVWLQGYFNHGFADDKIRVASIDTVSREVTFSAPHMYGLASGQNFNQYVALNILEELDQPGEWFADSASGVLFFWPPRRLDSARISLSILEEPLIALENTSYCTLEDLIIEQGRGLGIYMEGGKSNRIMNCVVRNFGTVAVMLGRGAVQTFPHATADDYEGVPAPKVVGSYHSHLYLHTDWYRHAGTGHVIEGCEVYNAGSGGIILGGGDKVKLTPGRNRVTDCRIHDFNRRNKAGASGVIVDGCGNVVTHNEIYNADLQAILVHGNDHVFEYNHIHHVALNSNDASAWYLGRDPSDQGNIVRWNFFHHVGRPDRKWMMGVYCDDATCGVRIEGNVFYRVASYGTVYSNGGHDIVVRNNVFIEGYGPAFQLKSMWYDFGIGSIPYFFGERGIYTRRLTKAVDITKPPYSDRYPLLADWLDLLPDGKTYVGMRPRRNVFEDNVIVKYEETFRLVGKHAQTEFGDNFITDKDPGFVDAAQLDFRIVDSSAVFKELPRFQRIPFEKIGPRPGQSRSEK